jgi:hypothetical protein
LWHRFSITVNKSWWRLENLRSDHSNLAHSNIVFSSNLVTIIIVFHFHGCCCIVICSELLFRVSSLYDWTHRNIQLFNKVFTILYGMVKMYYTIHSLYYSCYYTIIALVRDQCEVLWSRVQQYWTRRSRVQYCCTLLHKTSYWSSSSVVIVLLHTALFYSMKTWNLMKFLSFEILWTFWILFFLNWNFKKFFKFLIFFFYFIIFKFFENFQILWNCLTYWWKCAAIGWYFYWDPQVSLKIGEVCNMICCEIWWNTD